MYVLGVMGMAVFSPFLLLGSIFRGIYPVKKGEPETYIKSPTPPQQYDYRNIDCSNLPTVPPAPPRVWNESRREKMLRCAREAETAKVSAD